jgi:hypothetical protein
MQPRFRWVLAAGLLAVSWSLQAQNALVEGTGFYGFDTGTPNPTLLNVVQLDQYGLLGKFLDPGNQYYTEGRVMARAGQLGVALRPDAAGYDFQIRSRASFSDFLTFSAPGTVTLRAQVNGTALSGASDSRGSLVFGIEMGTALGQRSGQGALSFSTGPGGVTVNQLGCSTSVTCAASPSLGLPSFDLAFAFSVLANTPYQLTSNLQAIGRNNLSIFFNNTATMSFDLAPGTSMSSRSGVFLTPVPEPSSWALMVGGTGLLAWLTGQRRGGATATVPTPGAAGPDGW